MESSKFATGHFLQPCRSWAFFTWLSTWPYFCWSTWTPFLLTTPKAQAERTRHWIQHWMFISASRGAKNIVSGPFHTNYLAVWGFGNSRYLSSAERLQAVMMLQILKIPWALAGKSFRYFRRHAYNYALFPSTRITINITKHTSTKLKPTACSFSSQTRRKRSRLTTEAQWRAFAVRSRVFPTHCFSLLVKDTWPRLDLKLGFQRFSQPAILPQQDTIFPTCARIWRTLLDSIWRPARFWKYTLSLTILPNIK